MFSRPRHDYYYIYYYSCPPYRVQCPLSTASIIRRLILIIDDSLTDFTLPWVRPNPAPRLRYNS